MSLPMQQAAASSLSLGIDGGGTGCRARLVDGRDQVLGEGQAGPANLQLGAEVVADAVRGAADVAFAAAGLSLADQSRVQAGLGLAGANVPSLATAFSQVRLPFGSVTLASDAVIACLGAHAGGDGAILILGTGSQGLSIVDGKATAIGGWGFLLGDEGSGAVLGRGALRAAVAAVDGLGERSAMTDAIMTRFGDDPAVATDWARPATPRDYAAFAPVVFEHGGRGDAVAVALLRANAALVDITIARLVALGAERIVLVGGLAEPWQPWLSHGSRAHLVGPKGDALDGAIRLARGAGRGP